MLKLTEDKLYIGQRVSVDEDEGTVAHLQECDFHTATIPSVHTKEKVFTVHFDDMSICQFRGNTDINEYNITAT